jgi:hypothetical protein
MLCLKTSNKSKYLALAVSHTWVDPKVMNIIWFIGGIDLLELSNRKLLECIDRCTLYDRLLLPFNQWDAKNWNRNFNKIFAIHSALNWSRKLFRTKAIAIFQSMCHSIHAFPSICKIGGISFYGPKKCYYLNKNDKQNLLKINTPVIANYCHSYEKCIVNGRICGHTYTL